VPWTESQLKGRHFYPTRRSLLSQTPGWTDNFFFLSVLQKLEQRAKKRIEFRVECVEEIPSLVAVACFLPGKPLNRTYFSLFYCSVF
jgi:hypothetical protein